MSAAIRIENLGKKYTITRQRQSGSGYVSLRDVLSDGTKRMVQKILHPRGERGEEGASGTQEFWALKDINLEVEQGDKLAIIGHNGAGKSTLLKVLSRITEPTTGRITLHGRIASLLEVGTGFHPELTGRENIFLNGSILGMSQREIKHKFDEIVDFSGVETFLDTPVKRYSSGMRMRLGFAVAAHLDSEILVIDEVLAVGDAAFQKKCLGKMDDVSRSEGKTILFVSHNTDIVQALCNKSVVMNKGQIIFEGDVRAGVECYCQNIKTQNLDGKIYKTETLELLDAELVQQGQDEPLSVYEGSPVQLRMSVRSSKQHKNVIVMAVIQKLSGDIQGLLSSDVSRNEINLAEGDNRITCYIDDIPFLSGTYYITLKLITVDGEKLNAPEYRLFFIRDSLRGEAISMYRKWAGEALINHHWKSENT